MLFIKVERTNTFLEGQEGFIDFSAINLGLLVSVHGVCTTLTTSQINEAYLAV